VRAIIFAGLAIAVWRFAASRMSIEQAYDNALPELRAFLRQLGFNVNHSKLLGLIQHAFTLNSRTLTWLALAAGAYAVIEIIEAVGLWLLKRWGEYFAMIATSVGIPYEIYDLTAKVTVLRLAAFVINVALVVYLVVTKRLFGVRGGKRAYEARLRSASILQAEIDALAAAPAPSAAPGPPGGEAAGPGGAATAGGPGGPGETATRRAASEDGETATRRAASEDGEAATPAGPGQPDTAAAPGGPGQPGEAGAAAGPGEAKAAAGPGEARAVGRAEQPTAGGS
jgi:uncharacterized membrane protein (DUF2068 family)